MNIDKATYGADHPRTPGGIAKVTDEIWDSKELLDQLNPKQKDVDHDFYFLFINRLPLHPHSCTAKGKPHVHDAVRTCHCHLNTCQPQQQRHPLTVGGGTRQEHPQRYCRPMRPGRMHPRL
jgi:hypothetical protein